MPVPPDPQTIINVVENKVKENSSVCGAVGTWCCTYWKAILSELVSTCLLLSIGCMSAIPIDGVPYPQTMYTPLTFGFAVLLNISIFGHLSGAHMNPSVTLAAVLWGSLSIGTAIGYVLAQCAGAIIGYGIVTLFSPLDVVEGGYCVTQPHAGLTILQAIGIEVVLTSTLNFLNCAVWDPVNKDKTESIPLKFGITVAGLSLAGGPLTGASMNPARSLGPSVFTGIWTYHWLYWVGPAIGAILPTLIYKNIWLKKEKSKSGD